MKLLETLLVTALLAATAPMADPLTVTGLRDTLDSYRMAQAFDCRDVSCKRLGSCEEACFKLHQCGQGKRDADNDGIPCENLCRRRC